MRKQDKWLFSASAGSRFIAYLLDVTFTQLLYRGIAFLLSLDAGRSSPIDSLAFLAYFIFFHSQYGWTPGKKIMGLELINEEGEEKPSLPKVILRETLGRFISTIFLMLGYLMIFTNENKQGFHDKLAKTRVITVHSSADEGHSILKFIVGGVCLCLASLGLLVYIGLFTSLPLKHFAHGLESHGICIDDLRGNLFKGFSVGQISYVGSRGTVSLENVTFRYQGLFESMRKREFRIIQISATEILLDLKEKPPDLFATQKSEPKNKLNDSTKSPPGQRPQTRFSLFIEQFDLANVNVRYQGEVVMQADKIVLSDLNVLSTGQISVNTFRLESPKYSANLDHMILTKNILTVDQFKIFLKREFNLKILAGDVDLQGNGMVDFKNRVISGEVKGFRESLKVISTRGGINFQMANFQPHWYFTKAPPIHSINLSIAASNLVEFFHNGGNGGFVLGRFNCHFAQGMQRGRLFPAQCRSGDKMVFVEFKFPKGDPPLNLVLSSPNLDSLESILGEAGGLDNRGQFFTFEKGLDNLKNPPLRLQIRSPANHR
ncbi:MAG: RDD family protein [Bdellovibrionales bacterium]|nr:RDD family protein [Bdellovibrionales bacterium]